MKKSMLLLVAFVLLCLVGCENEANKNKENISATPSPAITSIVIGDLEIVTPGVTPGVENTRMPYPNMEFNTISRPTMRARFCGSSIASV